MTDAPGGVRTAGPGRLEVRPPASIKPWLSTGKMEKWVGQAPDEDARKRRLSVWLTHTEKLHARDVAERLEVSVQAVWLWVGQYNRRGPGGLDRKGRGGSRRTLMSLSQEKAVLSPFLSQARAGNPPRAEVVKKAIEKKLGRKVSLPYVYALQARHGWARIIAQSHPGAMSAGGDTFQTMAAPWQR